MSLRRLAAIVVVTQFIALGVFMAFLLGWIYSQGGRITLDITRFGEGAIEYWSMFVLVGLLPYALYILDPQSG